MEQKMETIITITISIIIAIVITTIISITIVITTIIITTTYLGLGFSIFGLPSRQTLVITIRLNEPTPIYWGYIGIMEEKMETTRL